MREEQYELAWEICEQALRQSNPRTRNDTSQPFHLRWVWDGRPIDGQHILVRCYHGLGDTIQFARYLPLLGKHAASVTVEVEARLLHLFEQLSGIDRLIAFNRSDPAPESDCDIEITELAFALRAPPSKLPPPYLHFAPAPLPGGTIGLCLEAGEWDKERSIPPELFLSICNRQRCLNLVTKPTNLLMIMPEGCPHDLPITAALVAGVELVVTVDTMIAHLAGAMNKPTWLLLKHEPDWRWSPQAGRSAWYPSLRIYAQPSPGDWLSVVAQVERDLQAHPTGAREMERSR